MDCENYNPCTAMKPTSAAFNVEEDLPYPWGGGRSPDDYWHYHDVGDTISSGFVYFEPVDTNADYYEWHIGGGIYIKKRVQLQIDDADTNTTMKAQLIIKKKASLKCFPDDDGIDTVTRYVRIVNIERAPHPMSAYWQGSFEDNLSDTFTMFFEMYPTSFTPIHKTYPFWWGNFPKGLDTVTSKNTGFFYPSITYHEIQSYIINDSYNISMNAWLNIPADSIFIRCTIDDKTKPVHIYNIKKFFKGKRIK